MTLRPRPLHASHDGQNLVFVQTSCHRDKIFNDALLKGLSRELPDIVLVKRAPAPKAHSKVGNWTRDLGCSRFLVVSSGNETQSPVMIYIEEFLIVQDHPDCGFVASKCIFSFFFCLAFFVLIDKRATISKYFWLE